MHRATVLKILKQSEITLSEKFLDKKKCEIQAPETPTGSQKYF